MQDSERTDEKWRKPERDREEEEGETEREREKGECSDVYLQGGSSSSYTAAPSCPHQVSLFFPCHRSGSLYYML